MEVGEVEEAAERRARNLQRRQNQMETEVADSPGLERQGSSTNRRGTFNGVKTRWRPRSPT